jgi:hypothetical protein
MGSATIVADLNSPSPTSQLATRLVDIAPSGNETLIARGLYRPEINSGTATTRQVWQLHPNGWKVEAGHIVKLELLPADQPYGRNSNGQGTITVSNLELRIPVLEQPGTLSGLVDDPAPKDVPAGYQLSADYITGSYVRPKGATPLRVALVPAYAPCTTPNRTHGPPLAFPSCNPPQLASSTLTVGTPDANAQAANSMGFVRYDVIVGDQSTPANEEDLQVQAQLTDVRRKSDLSDYTGQLQVNSPIRITDRINGSGGNEPATVVDIPFPINVPCSATASSTVGATCSVNTSFNAVTPGAVQESARARAVVQMGAVQVFDGGADGNVATAPNTVFATQGVFVP